MTALTVAGMPLRLLTSGYITKKLTVSKRGANKSCYHLSAIGEGVIPVSLTAVKFLFCRAVLNIRMPTIFDQREPYKPSTFLTAVSIIPASKALRSAAHPPRTCSMNSARNSSLRSSVVAYSARST